MVCTNARCCRRSQIQLLYADASRGVLLKEAAGPAGGQLQPADMGQPDEILQSLDHGYLDEPGPKSISPAGAAAPS